MRKVDVGIHLSTLICSLFRWQILFFYFPSIFSLFFFPLCVLCAPRSARLEGLELVVFTVSFDSIFYHNNLALAWGTKFNLFFLLANLQVIFFFFFFLKRKVKFERWYVNPIMLLPLEKKRKEKKRSQVNVIKQDLFFCLQI